MAWTWTPPPIYSIAGFLNVPASKGFSLIYHQYLLRDSCGLICCYGTLGGSCDTICRREWLSLLTCRRLIQTRLHFVVTTRLFNYYSKPEHSASGILFKANDVFIMLSTIEYETSCYNTTTRKVLIPCNLLLPISVSSLRKPPQKPRIYA